MERKTVLFLIVSFVILGFYPMVLQHFYPEYYKSQKEFRQKKDSIPATDAQSVDSKKSSQRTLFTAENLEHNFSSKDDSEFKNDNLILLFNKKGGAIHEVSFPNYADLDTQKPLLFLSLKGPDANTTLVRLTDILPETTVSTIPDYRLDIDSGSVVRASAIQNGIQIRKTISFKPGQYFGDLEVRFENTTDSPIEFRYELYAGSSIVPRHSIDSQYIEGNFFSHVGDKDSLQHITESKLGKSVESRGSVDWVAIKDRHFSIVLKPKPASFTGIVRGLGDHHFSVSLLSQKIVLPPHGSAAHPFVIYLGPNELKELAPAGFDKLVNFGKLDLIGRLLVGALEMLDKIFKNYGLTIIVLTALINLLLFPLTRVSYMSMKRMQLIQPHMNKLKEQHKKNPEKLNKEMMELYKKHKVNPFGGCLPMILQTPVFIALYVALSKSAILINAKFLWIKDLSSPDRLPIGISLPFVGNEVHLLPLIMCAAMFFQQKLTQVTAEGQNPTMASQQKMMMWMMPIMFGFIFYSMPSALVIYWLTNTVIMASYQLYLKKVTLT